MRKLFIAILFLFLTSAYSLADYYGYWFETSTTNLAGDATYSSACYALSDYKTLNVNILSSHDSAADGVKILFYRDSACSSLVYSADAGGWTYTAGTSPESYSASVRGEYGKVTYTNGSTLTTSISIYIFATK